MSKQKHITDVLNLNQDKGGFLVIPYSSITFGLSECLFFSTIMELDTWYKTINIGIRNWYIILPVIGKVFK